MTNSEMRSEYSTQFSTCCGDGEHRPAGGTFSDPWFCMSCGTARVASQSVLTVRCEPSAEDAVADFLTEFHVGFTGGTVSVDRSDPAVFVLKGDAVDLRFLRGGLLRMAGVEVVG